MADIKREAVDFEGSPLSYRDIAEETQSKSEVQPGVHFTDSSEMYQSTRKFCTIEFTSIPIADKAHGSANFKAFITEFNDQYTSDWNDVPVYGRMDPISTFQGTRRQINFGFDVVSYSQAEAERNHDHSQRLISFLYPVYDSTGAGLYSASTITAAPLIKIKFANLMRNADQSAGAIDGLVGKLFGINYQPVVEAGFYDNPKSNQLLPKLNRFSCQFTVFHTHGLGFDTEGNHRMDGFPYGWESQKGPIQGVEEKTPEANEENQVDEEAALGFGDPGYVPGYYSHARYGNNVYP